MDMMRMWYWIRRVDSVVDAKEQEVTFLSGCCAVGAAIRVEADIILGGSSDFHEIEFEGGKREDEHAFSSFSPLVSVHVQCTSLRRQKNRISKV
jgi:hypothetical protein